MIRKFNKFYALALFLLAPIAVAVYFGFVRPQLLLRGIQQAFPISAEDEWLIIVASTDRSLPDNDLSNEIKHNLLEKSRNLNIDDMRVEIAPFPIKANGIKEAKIASETYDANIVIWVDESKTALDVQFLFLQESPSLYSCDLLAPQHLRLIKHTEGLTDTNGGSLKPSHIISIIVNGYITAVSGDITLTNQAAQNLEQTLDQLNKLGDETSSLAFFINWLYQLSNEFEVVAPNYEKMLDQNPQNARIYNNLGCAYIYRYGIESVLEALNKAIELDPELAEAYVNLGFVQMRDNQLENSIESFNKAIAINPNYGRAYYQRGNIHDIQGNRDGAIIDFNKAIEIDADGNWVSVIASDYTRWGVDEYNQGNLSKAIGFFSYAIRLDPEFGEPYYHRSLAHHDNEEEEKAINDLNEYISLNENSPWVFIQAGKAHMQWGDFNGALSDFTKAIEFDPQYPMFYLDRAGLYFKPDRLEEANLDLDQFIILSDPNAPWAYFQRAEVRFEWGDIEGAIADYEKAIELEPENPEAYFERAKLFIKIDDWERALVELEKFIELNSANAAWAFNERGELFMRHDETEKAISDFTRAIELNADFYDAYVNRGFVFISQEKLDQALLDFNQAISIYPENDEAYTGRGKVFFDQNKLEDSITEFSKAVDINPGDDYSRVLRGISYYYMDRFEEALTDFNQAIVLASDYPWGYAYRGLVRYELDNLNDAITDYDKAIELGLSDAWIYDNRGIAWYALNAYRKAIDDYSLAIELDPTYDNAYWGRGLSYRKIGNLEAALSDFKMYLSLHPNENNQDVIELIEEIESDLKN